MSDLAFPVPPNNSTDPIRASGNVISAIVFRAVRDLATGRSQDPSAEKTRAALIELGGSPDVAQRLIERLGAERRSALLREADAVAARPDLSTLMTTALTRPKPMILPGLRMSISPDAFQVDENDNTRPPLQYSYFDRGGNRQTITVTQKAAQERLARLPRAPRSTRVQSHELIKTSNARTLLAQEYAFWGLADQASIEAHIDRLVGALGPKDSLSTKTLTTYGVEYVGLYCRAETGDRFGGFPGTSDEPYIIMSSLTPFGQPWTVKTNIYENIGDGIDSGDMWGAIPSPLYVFGNGRPEIAKDFGLITQFMEHDHGDSNAYREEVDLLVKAAAAAAQQWKGISVPEAVQNAATWVINTLLGTGDDTLGQGQFVMDAPAFEYYANQEPLSYKSRPSHSPVRYHFWTRGFNGSSEYYAFFLVKKMQVMQT